ncbi:MAG: DinB family protein [Chloroflexota bacterium]
MATKVQIRKKDEILAALVETRRTILEEMSKLPEADRDRVFLGVWSVKDLLAHITGWDHANLEAVRYVTASQLPPFYNHYDRDWKTYNAMLVAKYKLDSFDEMLAQARDSQRQLIEFLKTVPPEAFNEDFGVRFRNVKVTIRRLLEADIKDVQTHHRQIVDFFKPGE